MLDITVVDIRAAVQIGTTRLTYHLGYLSKKKKKKRIILGDLALVCMHCRHVKRDGFIDKDLSPLEIRTYKHRHFSVY